MLSGFVLEKGESERCPSLTRNNVDTLHTLLKEEDFPSSRNPPSGFGPEGRKMRVTLLTHSSLEFRAVAFHEAWVIAEKDALGVFVSSLRYDGIDV